MWLIRPAAVQLIACDVFVTEATFGLPVFRHGDAGADRQAVAPGGAVPERAHLVGAYSLAAQRVIALLRAGWRSADLSPRRAEASRYYASRIDLGPLRPVRDAAKADLAGIIALCPPSALQEIWSRRFPDPVTAFASGWMRVRARARQRGVALPLVISDHADWDGLTAVIAATGASDIWVTHGAEDALVHWCGTRGLKARPLRLVGYGEEDEAEAPAAEGEGARP